ncbi:MAG: lactonase family protein [Chloroflexales bacterium]|nr:lactonase family protein [Chloroflexales bacterium]
MAQILVGTYNTPHQPGVAIMEVDGSGTNRIVSLLPGIENPSFMTQHGSRIYAVSETPACGGVVAITRQDNSLSYGIRRPSGGGWPCHVRVSNDGRFAVATNYGTGTVALLRIESDGSLTGLNDLAAHSGTGPNAARQGEPHAHSAIFTPDGAYVIAADLGTDELVFYTINTQTNQLVRTHTVNTPAGNGPRHTIFHPNGTALYVANEIACSVSVFAYRNSTLIHIADHSTITGANNDFTVADIHISPDQQFLYCTTRTDNTIAAYKILADGNLDRIGVYSCGGAWPRNFAIAPDGSYILVACQHDNHLAVLPRDTKTGAVGSCVATIPMANVSFVEFI